MRRALFGVLGLALSLGLAAPAYAQTSIDPPDLGGLLGGGGSLTRIPTLGLGERLIWPVRGRVISEFGDSRDGGKRRHEGIDIAASRGTPVKAAGSGYVSFAGSYGNYGNVVYLDHGGDFVTRYAHLNGFAVAQGRSVRQGDVIGYVGNTGNARTTRPHLHFETRVAGVAQNPRNYLP